MKKVISLFLCILLVLGLACFSYAESGITESPNIKVVIDGKLGTYTDIPIIVNGRTLLPLRAILTNLGVQNDDQHIIWNSTEKSVTIIKDSTTIKLTQGENVAYVNNTPVTLDVAPLIYSKNGRTYIPVRFVAQCLGEKVDWDGTNKVVSISKMQSIQEVKVSTSEEFLKAIGSNKKIILKQGVYNLSNLSKETASNDHLIWTNEKDGNELVIRNIENLTIEGEGDKPAEIVTESTYFGVLNFIGAKNIILNNIKVGYASSNNETISAAIYFENSNGIEINNSDITECPMGLFLEGVYNVKFNNISIHDCTDRIMTVWNSKDIEFKDSKLSNTDGYELITIGESSNITFNNCNICDNTAYMGDESVCALFQVNDCSNILVKNSKIYNNSAKYFELVKDSITFDNTAVENNKFQKQYYSEENLIG